MALGIVDISKLKKAFEDAVENCSVGKMSDSTAVTDNLRPVAVCPKCGSEAVTVVDSRHTDVVIKRRRKCLDCDHRYTAYEISAQDYEELVRLKLLTKGE